MSKITTSGTLTRKRSQRCQSRRHSGNWTSACRCGAGTRCWLRWDRRATGLRVKVLHGLGGCGKTRLALEAASRAQERGTEVWWVSASDENRLAAGMHAVGRQLGVTDSELRHGEAADLVRRQLEGRQQAWLLVFDNADDPQVLAGPTGRVGDGTGWLRPLRSTAGMTLVTSRDGRASSWGPWCGLCPVKILGRGRSGADSG